MNRRNFLIKTGAVVATVPFIGSALASVFQPSTTNPELEDLYSFLESKTVLHPSRGKVPFKLYPFQKEILKHIHENDKLIIVKARQIGMTTLLAGYAAWSNGLSYFSPFQSGYSHFDKLCFQFIGWDPIRNSVKKCVSCFDECNYTKNNMALASLYLLYPGQTKIIVCGTPDADGVFKRFVERHSDVKRVHYPLSKCMGLWSSEKIHYCLKDGVMDVNREVNALLV